MRKAIEFLQMRISMNIQRFYLMKTITDAKSIIEIKDNSDWCGKSLEGWDWEGCTLAQTNHFILRVLSQFIYYVSIHFPCKSKNKYGNFGHKGQH